MEKEQNKPIHNVNLLSLDLIMLFEKFGYEAGITERVAGKNRLEFFRSFGAKGIYPRFHMKLEIPSETLLPKVNTFHIDIYGHSINFTGENVGKKNEEINNLIEGLSKVGEKTGTQEILLSLLRGELLFGASREISDIKGFLHEERFHGLKTNEKVGEFRFSRRKKRIEDLDRNFRKNLRDQDYSEQESYQLLLSGKKE
ncbi:MAG: hypothetical protein HW400_514 [Candidatus Levybacteria bacterium]|nr:hypothetical protein [Candidatus Levybacteria bacterium]